MDKKVKELIGELKNASSDFLKYNHNRNKGLLNAYIRRNLELLEALQHEQENIENDTLHHSLIIAEVSRESIDIDALNTLCDEIYNATAFYNKYCKTNSIQKELDDAKDRIKKEEHLYPFEKISEARVKFANTLNEITNLLRENE